MSTANIKLPTALISQLKASTGEGTGQKAIEVAISEYLKFGRRLNLTKNLSKISFKDSFDPLKLRKRER